jgi:zinc transport system ATP-binding protein
VSEQLSVIRAGDPVARLRDVTIGYDERPAVTGIDLEIRAGEVVALVGPNGSGKSTLVRGLLGLTPVLSGQIELFGVAADRFAQRYRIGYVPQRHTVGGAIPSTVEEVVSSGRLARRRWFARPSVQDRAAVLDAIEAVGLSDRRRAAVATLSGGQQRRALIARALASQPDVMIMDEPTAGVDAANQAGLMHTLTSLVRTGLTLLIVTHEIEPMLPLLTRVVALDGGRLVHDGPVTSPGPAAGLGHLHQVPLLGLSIGSAGHDLAHEAPLSQAERNRRGAPAPSGWLGQPGVDR